MDRKSIIYLMVCVFLMAISCQTKKEKWQLFSPDNTLRLTIENKKYDGDTKGLYYSLEIKKDGDYTTVILPSPLGIALDNQDFTKGLALRDSSLTIVTDDYSLTSGKQKKIKESGIEARFNFLNTNGAEMGLVVRAYNDGVAFRYMFSGTSDEVRSIANETTGFQLKMPGKAWIQPLSHSYEDYYKNGIDIGTSAPDTTGWSLPALFEAEGAWILLAEADVNSTNCGVHLVNSQAGTGLYTVSYPLKEELLGMFNAQPASTLPWKTPWRVIMVGDNLGKIVGSNLVTTLSEPSKFDNNDWIKSGCASWSWWSDKESCTDYKKLKNYIDFSAEMGWEYTLVDAKWNNMKGGGLEELAGYANSKNVGLFIWYNSGGPHNAVAEPPRDFMHDPVVRRKEMERISTLGVKGIKVDFFRSDKQEMMKLYTDILRDAHDCRLLVNFHGSTVPKGWRRTYPNFVTMEGVRGAEWYISKYGAKDYAVKAPAHNTILPFTRNVIGPMDYTPVTFGNPKFCHVTTLSHELALSVVFESGITHFPDAAPVYQSQPGFVKDFLTNMPSDWDSTWFLSGYPGESVVLARQKDNVLFVGGINGKDVPLDVAVVLPISGNAPSNVELITDNRLGEFVFESRPYQTGDTLQVKLLPYGGFGAKVSLR